MQARGILSLIEHKDYGFPIPEKVDLSQNTYRAVTLNAKFEVKPVKAVNYFIIDYALKAKESVENVTFIIYDNLDNKIMSKTIVTSQNQLIIECDNWQEGVYWCKKVVKGLSIEKKKVLILRESTEEEVSMLINLYPNPAGKLFNISFSNKNYQNTSIQITDVKGVIIKEVNPTNFNKEVEVNTSNWQSGIYFVSLIKNNAILETIKLVVK